MKFLALTLLSILISQCASQGDRGLEVDPNLQTPPPVGETFSANNGQYIFAPGDVVVVTVRRHPKLSGSYLVRDTGYITMPKIGSIYANQRSVSMMRTAIQIKLRPHIKYPKVEVKTGRLGSYQVIFSGKVRKPGAYSYSDKTTLLQGIARAGGIAQNNAVVVLIRSAKDGKKHRYMIDYKSLLTGSSKQEDLVLERGDLVFIN